MKKTIRTKAHILSVPIKLYNNIVIYYIAMIGHRFINFIPEENSKSRFEQLLDLVTQLLNYTRGDADVALDWPPKPTNADKSAQISLEPAATKSTVVDTGPDDSAKRDVRMPTSLPKAGSSAFDSCRDYRS